MSKALIFSDLHLHSHKESVGRLNDCLKVLDWIFNEASKHDVEHILFLGDLFHERSKIDVLNYLRTFETFMRHMLENDPKYHCWLLVGNHDMYLKEKWDVNSVKPLSAIPKVHIIQEPCTLNIGGVDIDFCPHTENPFKELQKLKNGSKRKLLLGHMSVHGAKLNKLYGTKSDVIVEYDNDMVAVSADIFDDWEKTFLGHYHGAQNLNEKVEYVGSPLELSFGEAFEDKHIILFDLETFEKTYIKNTFSPKHYIIRPEEIGDYDLNHNFVRIELDCRKAGQILDLRKTITSTYKVASLDFKEPDIKKNDDEIALVEDAKNILKDENEMLKIYMKRRGVPKELNNQKLETIGQKIITKSRS